MESFQDYQFADINTPISPSNTLKNPRHVPPDSDLTNIYPFMNKCTLGGTLAFHIVRNGEKLSCITKESRNDSQENKPKDTANSPSALKDESEKFSIKESRENRRGKALQFPPK